MSEYMMIVVVVAVVVLVATTEVGDELKLKFQGIASVIASLDQLF